MGTTLRASIDNLRGLGRKGTNSSVCVSCVVKGVSTLPFVPRAMTSHPTRHFTERDTVQFAHAAFPEFETFVEFENEL